MRLAAASLACLLACAAPARAADPPALSPAQSAAVEQLIHDYLLNHPDVMAEALGRAEEAAKAADAASAATQIAQHKEELERDPTSPVLGDPNGDVTIVEFFDYRCPYCKASAPIVEQLLKDEPKVRLVLKDIPILGPDSVYASRVSIVAARHGRFKEFWQAMFQQKEKANPEATLKIAKSVGLDPAVVKAEMESPQVDAVLKQNLDLAHALKIDGTPSFIIGTTLEPGAVSLAELRAQIAAVRKGPA